MFSLIPVFIVLVYLISSIKILAEYERGVIFRLGRVLPEPKGPGIILVFAPVDRMVRLSLRTEVFEVPSQDVVTRDNVTVKVNAVVYFRVIDPTKAVIDVTNFLYATSQLAQTTLRSVLGEVELDELLSQREKLNVRLQSVLDQHTGPWGVKVAMVEVKQVDLPDQMIRAIARQAEAERERRAKVIHAEGELEASKSLAAAAATIQQQPAALQLRYLQTLVEIGSEKNTTVVFPLPLDILSSLGRALDGLGRINQKE
jgi:regulator of protease activity HflC (stomatin/prohibitin superfamily)